MSEFRTHKIRISDYQCSFTQHRLIKNIQKVTVSHRFWRRGRKGRSCGRCKNGRYRCRCEEDRPCNFHLRKDVSYVRRYTLHELAHCRYVAFATSTPCLLLLLFHPSLARRAPAEPEYRAWLGGVPDPRSPMPDVVRTASPSPSASLTVQARLVSLAAQPPPCIHRHANKQSVTQMERQRFRPTKDKSDAVNAY
jgi:hypothetical protein